MNTAHVATIIDADLSDDGAWLASVDDAGVAILWRRGTPPVATMVRRRPARFASLAPLANWREELRSYPMVSPTKVAVLSRGRGVVVYDDSDAVVWRRGTRRGNRLTACRLVLTVGQCAVVFVGVRAGAVVLVRREGGRESTVCRLDAAPSSVWLAPRGCGGMFSFEETSVSRWTVDGRRIWQVRHAPLERKITHDYRAFHTRRQFVFSDTGWGTDWRFDLRTRRWTELPWSAAVDPPEPDRQPLRPLSGGPRVSLGGSGLRVAGAAGWPRDGFGHWEDRPSAISTAAGGAVLWRDGRVRTPRAAWRVEHPGYGRWRCRELDERGVWSVDGTGQVRCTSRGNVTVWAHFSDGKAVDVAVGAGAYAWNEEGVWRLGDGGAAVAVATGNISVVCADSRHDRVVVFYNAQPYGPYFRVLDGAGTTLTQTECPNPHPNGFAFAPDGGGLWICHRGRYSFYQIPLGGEGSLSPPPVAYDPPSSIKFASASASHLVLGIYGFPGIICVNLRDGAFHAELARWEVSTVRFNADGSELFAGTMDGSLLRRTPDRGWRVVVRSGHRVVSDL